MDENLPQNPKSHSANHRLVIILLIVVGLLFGAWLVLTPAGFWGKLNAIGYSVCHQISARSFVLDGLQSPLCARCAGMYLGALIAVIAHFFWGRHGKFPPLWISLILGLGFLAFAFDGLNSALSFFPFFPSLYQTTNLTRLITGLAVGLAIGSVLMPVFNQTVWADWTDETAYSKGYRFPLLIVLLSLVGVAVYSQKPVFFYPFNILMGLSVLLILWLIHTTLASFILGQSNLAKSWREMLPAGLLGLGMVLLQIGIISGARYLLTGTWAPLFL